MNNKIKTHQGIANGDHSKIRATFLDLKVLKHNNFSVLCYKAGFQSKADLVSWGRRF